jgi:hypothetical protein
MMILKVCLKKQIKNNIKFINFYKEKSDKEIFAIIKDQIRSTEATFERKLCDKLTDRTSLSIRIPEVFKTINIYNSSLY